MAKTGTLHYDLAGKGRSQVPSSGIAEKVHAAANKVHPGIDTHLTSGQEPKGRKAVGAAHRHPLGFAGDFSFSINGKKVTDQKILRDIAKTAAAEYGANIGYSNVAYDDSKTKKDNKQSGYYMGPDTMHIDTMPLNIFSGGAQWGVTAKQWADMLNTARASGIGVFPDTADIPRSLATATAIEQAYRDPMRALDIAPQTQVASLPSRPRTTNPPARFPGVPSGTITRSPLAAIPASLTPAPVGKVERAPLGPVGQFSQPARSLAHPVSSPPPSRLAAAPVGQVTKGPALAPATPSASTLAAQYSQYRPSTATSMPTVAGMPSIPAPTGLPAAKPVAQPLQHPVSVPTAPVAPAPVLAPALAPPRTVQDYNVAEYQAPPAAPAPTAYDVYSGLATQARDNTGQNTVGMLPDGTTTVTNKYGVTTGMTPYGKQTAVGSLPGISGPVKGALPGIAGSMLGGYLGGPVGAIAGGLLGKAFAPGGIFSGTRNIDTSQLPAALGLPAVTQFARPEKGGAFPSAPSGGYGSGGKKGASFSNRSSEGMRSMSPKAAADIDAGRAGLF